ncbi:MAG: UDP-3-O-(3-hydroxymyristoyl)glucosamine N-acyltransferase, partial [Mangrovicoccus sp.]
YGLAAAIFMPRPRYALAGISTALDPDLQVAPGIHPSAVIDPTAKIGANPAIGPFVYIGAHVIIGANATIAPQVTIQNNARIGDNSWLHPSVTIGPDVTIGNNFRANPGAVIGGDGFSFVTPEASSAEQVRASLGAVNNAQDQSWTRIHSLGSVTIGDDVEIGSNASIDRGTVRDTRIGRGTKLDNQVHIGHNVEIGEDSLLCGQVGVAGSTKIGNRVIMAGQCGVNDNIFIGDDVVAGGASKIFTNVPKGRVVLGSPAIKMATHVEIYKSLRRLPRLFRDVAALQKAVPTKPQSD